MDSIIQEKQRRSNSLKKNDKKDDDHEAIAMETSGKKCKVQYTCM